VIGGSQASPYCPPPGMNDVKIKMNVKHVAIVRRSLLCFIPRPKTCRRSTKWHLIGLCWRVLTFLHVPPVTICEGTTWMFTVCNRKFPTSGLRKLLLSLCSSHGIVTESCFETVSSASDTFFLSSEQNVTHMRSSLKSANRKSPTTLNPHWEAKQRVMPAELCRLSSRTIAIVRHLVESKLYC